MGERIKPTEVNERNIGIVTKWVMNISEKQEVEYIDPKILRSAFKCCGANFENLSPEARENLSKYTELDRESGVKAVWGDEFVDNIKNMVGDYIKKYESDTGIELPRIYKPINTEASTWRKNSGMIQFFNDLTSFASGKYNFETFKTLTESRIQNGIIHQENQKKKKANNGIDPPDKQEKLRVKVPGRKKLIVLPSIPLEFPTKVWGWITKNGLK